MTESTFPFEATAEEPETGDNRRKMVLVAGAGALAVAVLGYFVVVPMLSGPASESSSFVAVHHAPKKKTTAVKKPAAKPAAQPASYNDISARQDPFRPLVEVPPPAAPAATTGDGTTGTTDGTTAPAAVAGTRVILLHVYSKDGKSYASTKVGDKVYTPVVGSTFAESYKLLAVNGTSATYLFGEEQFSLSEGQEVVKG